MDAPERLPGQARPPRARCSRTGGSALNQPAAYPNIHTFILPSRAYLLSFREQTLPARRGAIIDARSYYEQFSGDEGHAAQLALLGLMGETLQVVEDVGVLANALLTGLPGLSFYVKATSYDPNNVNNFYAQAHKRDDDYYLRLSALKFAGISVTEQFSFSPSLHDADHEAIAAAEHATAVLLRDLITWLGKAWEDYRQLFHAYKHGALIANPDDVHLVEDRKDVIARMAVWRRRRKNAEVGTHISGPLAEIASYTAHVGEVALDAATYIVDTRLSVFEWMRITEDGSIEDLQQGRVPWYFWFRGRDIEQAHIERLEERFGINFEPVAHSLS